MFLGDPAPLPVSANIASERGSDRAAAAQRLFSYARPVPGTLGEKYLRGRSIGTRLDRPALAPGEGSIGRYRKWTRQFYSPPDQVPAANSEPATQAPAANSESATQLPAANSEPATLEAKTF